MKHISDSERLTLASLNKKETELKQVKEELYRARQQAQAMNTYIRELRENNKILANQVRYLAHRS